MVYKKKAISPVVATALLLVVAVVAVVGFQGWYQSFQSDKLVDVSGQADAAAAYSIQAVSATGEVFVKNSGSSELVVTSIIIDGTICTINAGAGSSNVSASTSTNISVTVCNITAETATSVLLVTNNGVINEKLTAID